MTGPAPQEHGTGGREPARASAYSKAPITPDTPVDEAGRWHRLHPLTPLLRGGWFVIAVFGWIISQQWQRLTSLILPDQWDYEDPTFTFLNDPVRLLLVLGGTIVVALVIILLSYLAWRAASYRLTDELFEVRVGIVTKKHRQARLDRVQSIDINRPMFARIFGAAAVVIDTASADGKIDLKYVRSAHAEPLREAILRRASGARKRAQQGRVGSADAPGQQGAPAQPGAAQAWRGQPGSVQGSAPVGNADGATDVYGPAADRLTGPDGTHAAAAAGAPGVIGAASSNEGRLAALVRERVDEFADFERDTRDANPQSIVTIKPGRIFAVAGLDILSVAVWLVLIAGVMSLIAFIVSTVRGLELAEVLGIQLIVVVGMLVPMVIVVVTIIGSRVTTNFNYSIVGTPNGVRMSKGFPSTKSETVPPGRIHAIEIRQPLLWRMAGWWEMRITRAGQRVDSSGSSGQNVAAQSVLMPFGKIDDVRRVLDLIAPDQATPERAAIIEAGMLGTPGDGYIAGPTRGFWLHPITYRRIGHVLADDTFYIRRGRWGRKLAIVPGERMQSIAVKQGPVLRALRLANLQAQTVQGVVDTTLPNLDRDDAIALFDRMRDASIRAARSDTSHRWSEAAARSAVSAARMRFDDAQSSGRQASQVDLAVLEAYRDYENEAAARGGGAVPGGAAGAAPASGPFPVGGTQTSAQPPAGPGPHAGEDGRR